MPLTSNRRRFLQGPAVRGGAGALAACSQQSSEEQAEQAAEENEQKAAEQAELPSTAWTRAEYDDVEDGGTLRLAVSQLPNNWNGSHADGALVDRSRIVDPMIGSGIIFTEDGEWELDSNYLVSAEVTSEDPQIVTVKYNPDAVRSEEHTSELQSRGHLVCRLLLEKKKNRTNIQEPKRSANQ